MSRNGREAPSGCVCSTGPMDTAGPVDTAGLLAALPACPLASWVTARDAPSSCVGWTGPVDTAGLLAVLPACPLASW
eukprot:355774-Chlamydomonas_euryale.AAC.1